MLLGGFKAQESVQAARTILFLWHTQRRAYYLCE